MLVAFEELGDVSDEILAEEKYRKLREQIKELRAGDVDIRRPPRPLAPGQRRASDGKGEGAVSQTPVVPTPPPTTVNPLLGFVDRARMKRELDRFGREIEKLAEPPRKKREEPKKKNKMPPTGGGSAGL